MTKQCKIALTFNKRRDGVDLDVTVQTICCSVLADHVDDNLYTGQRLIGCGSRTCIGKDNAGVYKVAQQCSSEQVFGQLLD